MASIFDLPLEIWTFFILPVLGNMSLPPLHRTSRYFQSIIEDYLASIQYLDLEDVFHRLGAFQRKKKIDALNFLTNKITINSLRKLRIEEKFSYNKSIPPRPLKKLLRINPNLEELILVNIDVTTHTLRLIGQLTKLKFLKLIPNVVLKEDVEYYKQITLDLKKKYGTICEVILHSYYYGKNGSEKVIFWRLDEEIDPAFYEFKYHIV